MYTVLAIIVAISAFLCYRKFKRTQEAELDREAQQALDTVRRARDEVNAVTKEVADAKIDYQSAKDAYRRKYNPGSDDEPKS